VCRVLTMVVAAFFGATAFATAVPLPPAPFETTSQTATQLNEDDRRARCGELKALIDILTPEVGASALRRAEVGDYQKMRTALSCPGNAVFAGEWQIVGTPKFPHLPPMKGTLRLTAVDLAAGRKLAEEPNWGLASSRSCRGGTFFYVGTVEWEKGSLFDRSPVYWTDKPSTIVLCTDGPDSMQAKGNFRDSREAHGGFIQFNGLSGGFIIPETNEGPEQTFTATKIVKK
jgi:hypothetical protein